MPASRVKGGACLRVVSPTYERTIVFSWLAYQARMMMCEGIRKHGGWNNEGDIHNFSSNGSYYARMRSCSPHMFYVEARGWKRAPPDVNYLGWEFFYECKIPFTWALLETKLSRPHLVYNFSVTVDMRSVTWSDDRSLARPADVYCCCTLWLHSQ